MGAAQDHARTKNQLVTACSQRSHSLPQVSRSIISFMDHLLSIMLRLTRAFARIFPHYGEARLNPADRVGLIWVHSAGLWYCLPPELNR